MILWGKGELRWSAFQYLTDVVDFLFPKPEILCYFFFCSLAPDNVFHVHTNLPARAKLMVTKTRSHHCKHAVITAIQWLTPVNPVVLIPWWREQLLHRWASGNFTVGFTGSRVGTERDAAGSGPLYCSLGLQVGRKTHDNTASNEVTVRNNFSSVRPQRSANHQRQLPVVWHYNPVVKHDCVNLFFPLD